MEKNNKNVILSYDNTDNKISSNNSKNIIDKFTLLLKDYEKKEIIIKKIERFIENEMPTMIDKWEKEEERNKCYI